MKTILSALALCLPVIAGYAQSKCQNWYEDFNFTGNVSKVIVKKYFCVEGRYDEIVLNDVTHQGIYTFNDKNDVVSNEHTYQDEDPQVTLYEYDADGRTLSSSRIVDDRLYEIQIMRYDYEGRLSEQSTYSNDGELYERRCMKYDDMSRLVEDVTYFDGSISRLITHKYDSKGNKVETVHKKKGYAVRQISSAMESEPVEPESQTFDEVMTTVYEYDQNGYCLMERFSGSEFFRPYENHYKRDKNGRLLEYANEYDEIVRYVYDDESGLLQMITVHVGGVLEELIEETYDHKGNLIRWVLYNGPERIPVKVMEVEYEYR